MDQLVAHLRNIDADRIERQRKNASHAFARASGRVIFKTGPTFVGGETKSARDLLVFVANTHLRTQIAFLVAMIEHACAQDCNPNIWTDNKGITFVAIQFPKFKKN